MATVMISVPLIDGRSYSIREFCKQSNEKLHTTYDLELIPDRTVEIDAREKALLRAMSSASFLEGQFKIEIGSESLRLTMPNPEYPDVRDSMRRRVESALGLNLTEWPADKGMTRPHKLRTQGRAVVLVHGLGSDDDSWKGFAKQFESNDVQVLYFNYPNEGSLADAGERLRIELNKIAAEAPELRVAIVGHSMGGLVARWAIESRPAEKGATKDETFVPNVTDLLMIGTPQQGSQLASSYGVLKMFREIAAPTDAQSRLQEGLGEAIADLHPSSRFLRDLETGVRPLNVRYHIAYGTRGIVSERERDLIVQKFDRFLQDRQVNLLKRARWVGLLKMSHEIVDGQGDGAVSVKSASLHDVNSIKPFHMSHLELIGDSQRADRLAVCEWILESIQVREVSR